jgi:uncharacterized protein (TIGR02145 family)
MNRFFTLLLAASCLTAGGQVPDYVPTDGLVGWYALDGDAADSGPNELNGLNIGANPSQNRFEEVSTAMYFDGQSVIELPSVNFSSTITVSLWIKEDEVSGIHGFLSKYDGDNGGDDNSVERTFNLYRHGGGNAFKYYMTASSNGIDFYDEPSFSTATTDWVHIAAVFGEQELKLFVNGTLDSTHEVGMENGYFPSDVPLIVGATFPPLDDPNKLRGVMDDLGIWERELIQEEILGLYNAPAPSEGCTDSTACNFNFDAELDDGSCHFLCQYCKEGTVWDEDIQGCIVANPSDSNFDGCVQLNDLLDLLSAYGDCGAEESAWQCGDPLEYQGYDYETVQIGDQCWFAENARYLPAVSPVLLGSEDDGMPHAYVYGYDGANTSEAVLEPNYQTYGGLYNYEAIQAWGLCPTGWSIPNQIEWDILTTNNSVLDCVSTSWFGTNLTGLDFLPGGDRDGIEGDNAFVNKGSSGLIWIEGDNLESPIEVGVYNEDWYIYGVLPTSFGLSVRCIKD